MLGNIWGGDSSQIVNELEIFRVTALRLFIEPNIIWPSINGGKWIEEKPREQERERERGNKQVKTQPKY